MSQVTTGAKATCGSCCGLGVHAENLNKSRDGKHLVWACSICFVLHATCVSVVANYYKCASKKIEPSTWERIFGQLAPASLATNYHALGNFWEKNSYEHSRERISGHLAPAFLATSYHVLGEFWEKNRTQHSQERISGRLVLASLATSVMRWASFGQKK